MTQLEGREKVKREVWIRHVDPISARLNDVSNCMDMDVGTCFESLLLGYAQSHSPQRKDDRFPSPGRDRNSLCASSAANFKLRHCRRAHKVDARAPMG
jgi:hypothetical protein